MHSNAFSLLPQVLKVHLSAQPEVYGRAPGDVTGDKVNKNLLFDTSLQHLYITTEKKVRLTQTRANWLSFFTKSISLRLCPSNTSVSPHKEGHVAYSFYFIHQVRDLMSRSFILPVLFDHLFIRSANTNTSVYITAQKSAIDLFSRFSSPLCVFLSAFSSSSVFLFLLSFHLSVAIVLSRHTEVELMLLIQKWIN